mmetsp:Transcript_45089/g.88891  ORF Transcript_45089/g.88891 Transcript_45089/m.88891 type:complete len:112 (+) Transcript_45089:1445-1780(+)
MFSQRLPPYPSLRVRLGALSRLRLRRFCCQHFSLTRLSLQTQPRSAAYGERAGQVAFPDWWREERPAPQTRPSSRKKKSEEKKTEERRGAQTVSLGTLKREPEWESERSSD